MWSRGSAVVVVAARWKGKSGVHGCSSIWEEYSCLCNNGFGANYVLAVPFTDVESLPQCHVISALQNIRILISKLYYLCSIIIKKIIPKIVIILIF